MRSSHRLFCAVFRSVLGNKGKKKKRFVPRTLAHKYMYSFCRIALCAEPNFFLVVSGKMKNISQKQVGLKHNIRISAYRIGHFLYIILIFLSFLFANTKETFRKKKQTKTSNGKENKLI